MCRRRVAASPRLANQWPTPQCLREKRRWGLDPLRLGIQSTPANHAIGLEGSRRSPGLDLHPVQEGIDRSSCGRAQSHQLQIDTAAAQLRCRMRFRAFFVIPGPRKAHILRKKPPAWSLLSPTPWVMEDRGQLDAGGARDELRHVSLGFGHPRRIAPVGHLSNNLANAETPGFQADFALAMQRQAPAAAADAPDLGPNALLARLGGGLFTPPTGLMSAPDPWNAPKTPSTLPWKQRLAPRRRRDRLDGIHPGWPAVGGCRRTLVRGQRTTTRRWYAIITMDPNATPVIQTDGTILEMVCPSPNSEWICCPQKACRRSAAAWYDWSKDRPPPPPAASTKACSKVPA